MEAERSEENVPDERLCAVLLDFMESAERGVLPNRAALLAQHPELAPELEEFLDTWVRVEHLTEPVRSASQVLQQANLAGLVPDTGGDAGDTAMPATRVPGIIKEPAPGPIGRSRDPGQEEGGWLGRWLRAHPPLVAADYPFLAAQRPQEIGRLGHFRLLEIIGSGGMGVVFRGEDVALQRPVAVKVLRAELAVDPRFRERFLREARSAASVEHEHVISVYHVGEESGIPFMGMQWLRGISLEDLLRRAGQLSVTAVVRLGRQIALGLAAAHAQGLLHRDIKPANLWIELAAPGTVPPGAEEDAASTGRVRILDFGLVRAISDEGNLTVVGTAVGTPAYMAPEQGTGASVDARCDLFSLGVVLYRMCTGRLPFPARHQMAVIGLPAVESPPIVRDLNPAVPPGLADLIMSLLARDPAGRPASAAEVAEQIRSLEGWQIVPVSPGQPPMPGPPAPSGGRSSQRHSGRRWGLIFLVALVALMPLGYQFGGTVLRFATKQGQVVIEVDDPDMEVTVTEGGAVILDRKRQRQVTLAAGEHEFQVTFKDAAGESHFFTKTLVLTRGGKEILLVRREPASVAPPSAGPPERGVQPNDLTRQGAGADRDRRAAEWALSLRGNVWVHGTKGQQEVAAAGVLPAGVFRLVALDLGGTRVNDAALAHIATLTDLELLDLRKTQVGDAGLMHLSGLRKLRGLNLNGTLVGDVGLAQLRALPQLEMLELGMTQVSEAGLVHIKSLTTLRSLGLHGTHVTDAGLVNIATMAKLAALDLGGNRVGDDGLSRLGPLQNLRSLNLNDTRVSDAGVSCLRALSNLESLVLQGTKVSDAGVANLEHFTALRDVDLNGTQVGDAGMASLAAIKNLHGVCLTGSRVTDAGLVHFKGVQHLLGLDLTNTRVSDAGLAHLAGLTHLQNLRLSGTQVTDAGLAHLAGMTDMQQLRLTNTHVHDAGLAQLGAMKHLRELYLDSTCVTDAGLAHLLSLPLPPVKVLDLSGSRVSATGAAAVKAILPGARVEWWEPNRRAAEAVFSAGGSVHVRTTPRGSDVMVKTGAALPADYFRLTRAGLQGVGKPSRELLLLLASLTNPEFDDLNEVDLTAAAVSDADLESLVSLPCRRLVLNRCPVTGPGLVQLKKLPRLTDLSVECPTLSFLGARYVGELKRLERLSLAGSGATDASLKNLHDLVKLREIDLTGTKVTAEGVAALREALPMCDIKMGPAGPR